MSENLVASAVVPASDRLLAVSESLTVPGVFCGQSAWRSKVRVGAPSRACVGLAQVDGRAAASGRDLLDLCDSGAEHASGVEGAPSPFFAGLAEAGSRNVIQIVVVTLSCHLDVLTVVVLVVSNLNVFLAARIHVLVHMLHARIHGVCTVHEGIQEDILIRTGARKIHAVEFGEEQSR